jgi:tetratricopeptide (TPR) repeat protein
VIAATLNQLPPQRPIVNQVTVLDRGMREIAAAGDVAVVVITGAPGAGKTATAIELANRVKEVRAFGAVLYATLDDLDRAGREAEILYEFLKELGRDPVTIPDRLDARAALYRTVTMHRPLLVVLDGAVSAAQVEMLVPGGAGSVVVVTEARPLGALAARGRPAFLDLAPFEDHAALALFERMLGADYVAANRAQLTTVVELCDRLPLALCVVGSVLARSPGRPIERTVAALREERRRLRMLSRDTDLSINASFGTAYAHLTEVQRPVFHGLGLAPGTGSWSADALAAALDLDEFDVDGTLRELADARLVTEHGDRYVASDLLRLYARDTDDTDPAPRAARLLDHYLDGAAAADALIAPTRPWQSRFLPGPRPRRRFDDADEANAWLSAEWENLCAAVEYAHTVEEDAVAARLCVVLWTFLDRAKLLDAVQATHELGRFSAERLGDPALASLIAAQKAISGTHRREPGAIRDGERAVALAPGGDAEIEGTAVEALGLAYLALGRPAEAVAHLRRNLGLAESTGDERRIALARLHLAKALEPAEALSLLEPALAYFTGVSEPDNEGKTLTWLGKKRLAAGDVAGAAAPLSRALEIMKRPYDQAVVIEALGDQITAQGLAHQHYETALVTFETLRFPVDIGRVRGKLGA